MTAKSKELNRFRLLKKRTAFTRQNIAFLKRCKSKKVFPDCITNKVKIAVHQPRDRLLLHECLQLALKRKLNFHYGKLTSLELEAYQLHLKLTKGLTNGEHTEWIQRTNDFHEIVEHLLVSKCSSQSKKLDDLTRSQVGAPSNYQPTAPRNVVMNKSSVPLSTDELNLLENGLNFALPPRVDPTIDIVTDIEVAVAQLPFAAKHVVREKCKQILVENEPLLKQCNVKNEHAATLKSLNEKDIRVMKSDKGNSVVVMDNSEYDENMNHLIESGPYLLSRKRNTDFNPVDQYNKEIYALTLKYEDLFGKTERGWIYKVRQPNPRLPRLYGLPKIHKPGNSMRPISSNVGAPSERLAKWLVSYCNKFEKPPSKSVRNSIDFVDRIKDVILAEDEVIASFDVTALFPNIPLVEAIEIFETWIGKQNITPLEKTAIIELMTACATQNAFQFRGKFYIQRDGTAMGHPASPLLAELYMADFETKLSYHEYFPRIWLRYVDDIFVIIKRVYVTRTLDWMNSISESIKFTHEIEIDGKMPFLDVEIIRGSDGGLDFKIYRKATSTDSFINTNSFHCHNHKYAAFNSMVHRACSIPMSEHNFQLEIDTIHRIALKNGFKSDFLHGMIRRHMRNIQLKEATTLQPEKNLPTRHVGMTYFPQVTEKFKNVFRNVGLSLAYRSNNKIRNNVISTKDKLPMNDRSGVYEFKCNTNDCPKVYVGQTIRAARVRFDEHVKWADRGQRSKSAIAEHSIDYDHPISIENFRVIKEATGYHRVNTLEAIHIHRNVATDENNVLNKVDGNAHSQLFQVCR